MRRRVSTPIEGTRTAAVSAGSSGSSTAVRPAGRSAVAGPTRDDVPPDISAITSSSPRTTRTPTVARVVAFVDPDVDVVATGSALPTEAPDQGQTGQRQPTDTRAGQ